MLLEADEGRFASLGLSLDDLVTRVVGASRLGRELVFSRLYQLLKKCCLVAPITGDIPESHQETDVIWSFSLE